MILGKVPARELGSCKAVGTAEKSPFRIAVVMVVASEEVVVRDLKPSQFDMKKRRFFPLDSFRIFIGPPRGEPLLFWWKGGVAGGGVVALRALEVKSEFFPSTSAFCRNS